ncbi:hypothetical protein AMTR_s00038p00098690 [Amborella trichopoda]|uniref:Uncharacterized protein n=1 Tax=Amborella trichopoda TaxID=13333 RepID=U5CX98_AMBTC|nr:hypothetical protein AMTR_s00038p00098690 [Amborella trichopoda]
MQQSMSKVSAATRGDSGLQTGQFQDHDAKHEDASFGAVEILLQHLLITQILLVHVLEFRAVAQLSIVSSARRQVTRLETVRSRIAILIKASNS